MLCQEKNGFRKKRSITDNIFIMRQILEKCHESNIEMYALFIYFKQAFDLLTHKNHTDTTGIDDTKQVGTIN